MLSNLHFHVEDCFAEDDKVMIINTITGNHTGEFMGIPPTGRPFSVIEVTAVRIKEGKIVEEWGFPDMFSLLQQLGNVPSGQ